MHFVDFPELDFGLDNSGTQSALLVLVLYSILLVLAPCAGLSFPLHQGTWSCFPSSARASCRAAGWPALPRGLAEHHGGLL